MRAADSNESHERRERHESRERREDHDVDEVADVRGVAEVRGVDEAREGRGPEASAPTERTGPAPDRGSELMLAWQRGDESAFEALVALYSAKVWSLLTRFLGPRDRREDLVQEVFLRVVRARERYEPTARFATWLYQIVFRIAVNETQRSAPHPAIGLGAGAERTFARHGDLDVVDEGAAPPAAGLERDDVVRAVRAAIAALPPAQRMALVLAKYHDMPHAEIAAVVGSSEKAVKSLIHRARENLRAALIPFLEQEVA